MTRPIAESAGSLPASWPHAGRGTWITSAAGVAVVAWGILSLGAVRPWGYLPLIAGMTAIGAAGVLTRKPSGVVGRGLTLSLLALASAICIQLVPLPVRVVQAISPSTLAASSHATGDAIPLSIHPSSTMVGLAFMAAMSVFFVGSVRTMGPREVRRLAGGVVALGTVIALAGIAEASGLWIGAYRAARWPLPPDSVPHGPFSSRNHYAGWMLMSLAITIAFLCAALEEWRTVWPRRFLLLQCAATVMAVALVQTRSRAGIVGLALAVVTMGARLVRGTSGLKIRIVTAALMSVLIFTGIMVTGVQRVTDRFLVDSWRTAHGRLVIWRQAAAIARDFPIAGTGFNTYQHIVRGYPTAGLDEPYEGAHNDYLQLAAEGGLLVGLPVLSAVGFLVREMRQRLRQSSGDTLAEWLRVGAVTGLALLAIQETVDFSLQIPGIAALFVILAAIAVHRDHAVAVTA